VCSKRTEDRTGSITNIDMGYMRHNAIVVTTHGHKMASSAWDKACEIFPFQMVSPRMPAPINGYFSFFVGPDGSKEGWTESDDGDKARSDCIDWIHSQAYSDGSNPYAWAEIQYGDDSGEQKIVQASNMRIEVPR
jgi:hypothetical protein